jgi:hypothetical protein
MMLWLSTVSFIQRLHLGKNLMGLDGSFENMGFLSRALFIMHYVVPLRCIFRGKEYGGSKLQKGSFSLCGQLLGIQFSLVII